MKFYNDFNSMFNAQSGVKKDMSVFNDVLALNKQFQRFNYNIEVNSFGVGNGGSLSLIPVDYVELKSAIEVLRAYDPANKNDEKYLLDNSAIYRKVGSRLKPLTKVPICLLSVNRKGDKIEVEFKDGGNGEVQTKSFDLPANIKEQKIGDDEVCRRFLDCFAPNSEDLYKWFGSSSDVSKVPVDFVYSFIDPAIKKNNERVAFTIQLAKDIKQSQEKKKKIEMRAFQIAREGSHFV